MGRRCNEARMHGSEELCAERQRRVQHEARLGRSHKQIFAIAGVLDAAGGTDIFQMPSGRVKLTTGTDATVRWSKMLGLRPVTDKQAG